MCGRPRNCRSSPSNDASFLPTDYVSCAMTNRFGVDLYPKEVRWAAAEGVSEDVIAAVLLLHERSVEEVVPQLSPLELEKVIVLVGRSPRLYPRGILEALDRHKNSLAPAPITQSVPPNAAAVVSHNAAKPACQPENRTKSDADQMRQAHERRLAMLRARTPQSAPEPVTPVRLRPIRFDCRAIDCLGGQ